MKRNKKNQTVDLVFYEEKREISKKKKFLSNRVQTLNDRNSKKSGLSFLNRQRIGFSLCNMMDANLIPGVAQISRFFGTGSSNFFFLELSFENKDQWKKDFVKYSSLFLLNSFQKKSNCKPQLMTVIPNQTFFFQFLRIFLHFFNSKNFENPNEVNTGCFIEKDSKNLKYGKMMKPADGRAFYSEGKEDLIRIGGILKNQKLKISGEIEKCDLIFISPLAIRKLNPNYFRNLVSSIKVCFVDNFEALVMQNIENLFLTFKSLLLAKEFLPGKDSIKKKKKFPFDIFFTSLLPLLGKLKNLKNLGITRFEVSSQFFKNRKFKCNPLLKMFYFNFMKKKHFEGEVNRFEFFKKSLLPILINRKEKGVFIFLRSYSEYAFLRNFLFQNETFFGINVLCFSEYISFSEIKKKRSMVGRFENQIVLMTERFYYFFRHSINKSPTIFFYSIPLNHEFFSELVSSNQRGHLTRTVFVLFHTLEINQVEKIRI